MLKLKFMRLISYKKFLIFLEETKIQKKHTKDLLDKKTFYKTWF